MNVIYIDLLAQTLMVNSSLALQKMAELISSMSIVIIDHTHHIFTLTQILKDYMAKILTIHVV